MAGSRRPTDADSKRRQHTCRFKSEVLGLGATPVAIANMNTLTSQYGPSPKAFLVIPLIGAFFVDLMNALVIKFFLALPIMQQAAS